MKKNNKIVKMEYMAVILLNQIKLGKMELQSITDRSNLNIKMCIPL